MMPTDADKMIRLITIHYTSIVIFKASPSWIYLVKVESRDSGAGNEVVVVAKL
jgi:hypothetical protein